MLGMNVICARFNPQDKRIEVVREITNDDGSMEYNGLSFDSERLEWLSAEYEIDDLDELVELAIYSSLIPQEHRRDHPTAARARQHKREQLVDAKERLGPMLTNANKEVLKIKLREAGMAQEYIDAVDDDPVELIKRHSKFDVARINAKRGHVMAIRRGEKPSSDSPVKIPSPSAPKDKKVRNPNVRPVEVKLPKISLRGGKRAT